MISQVDSHAELLQIIASDKPTFVMFGATWCGPCQKYLPVVEEIAASCGEQGKVVKVDVDENEDSPGFFEI